ncbi:sulfite exporter TauE/SafE family protein [Clostridium fermenticellae]|uniref:Probable membrane transporter protein n=1 Tax=Clostridium fermenticellae TaxID=2068654 RepID=A0A386H198_9CLOT|nr:sulfite exporter TauE/SafE family protein [Clostridium fermenticellae]AYD39444.1 sulfite exporter TauE/SafE family protein [Clostridium fermenticellae]
MLKFFILIIVGFFMGMMTVAFGGGAGSVYVSILTIFFNVSPAIATSTSLATMFPTAAVSAFSHAKNSNVNYKMGWIMLAWGALGSIIGSLFSGKIPADSYNKLIGIVIILLTVMMIIRKLVPTKKEKDVVSKNKKGFVQASIFGLIGGLLSGLVGTSGTTAIIAGLTILGCSTMQVVGTSVFILAGISLVGLAVRAGVGTVDCQLAVLLAISAIVGALVGSFVLSKVIFKNKGSKNNKSIDLIIIIGNLAMGIAQLFK